MILIDMPTKMNRERNSKTESCQQTCEK